MLGTYLDLARLPPAPACAGAGRLDAMSAFLWSVQGRERAAANHGAPDIVGCARSCLPLTNKLPWPESALASMVGAAHQSLQHDHVSTKSILLHIQSFSDTVITRTCSPPPSALQGGPFEAACATTPTPFKA